MSLEKFKGIWPLPGGVRNYVLTLRKILERVAQENPTIDQLVSWLKSEYKLSGERAPYGGLRIVEKCLGFMQEIGGRLKLTPVAEEFLRTGENRLVLDALRRLVLGFEEILSMLAESQRLSLAETHKGLLERCNLDWKTQTQTMYRLNWLISLGFVGKEYGKYFLTDKGLEVVEPTPPSPPPPPAAPMDEYIKHSTALIEKHPTMSESNTTSTLIEPLLEVLGWNIRNPDEIQRQYPIHIGKKTEYVDIALKIQNEPVVFIEAKSVDTPLYDHLAEQPINYATTEGVTWSVLTNGRELRVYNAFWRIKGIEQKMFLKLSIDEFREKIDKLKLLSREAIKSGRLDEEGELEHARRIISEWLKQRESFVVKDVKELDPSLKEEYVRRILRGMRA